MDAPPPTRPLKYAKIERERRFLFPAPPADRSAAYGEIDDLYFPGTTLRLRAERAPLVSKLHQKEDRSAAERVITSVYLGRAEYELLARLPGKRLRKWRHPHREGGVEFGIDVVLGPLHGLVLGEAEAASEAELAAIPVPRGACCEVTTLPLSRAARRRSRIRRRCSGPRASWRAAESGTRPVTDSPPRPSEPSPVR